MKIVINETSEIQEVSARVASRLINKGRAHFVEKPIMPIEEPVKEVEVVTEIDLIEPIPERFTSFEKPKKRNRKKKSKFKNWKIDEGNSK